MQLVDLADADRAYLERVAEDCRRLLGAGIELSSVELLRNDEVALRVAYRLGSLEGTSEGRGDNLVSAHGALRQELVVDRIRLGLEALWR